MANDRRVVEQGLLEMSLTRRISAPPDDVFRAWIDAKQLAKWWGPKGFTNPVCWRMIEWEGRFSFICARRMVRSTL